MMPDKGPRHKVKPFFAFLSMALLLVLATRGNSTNSPVANAGPDQKGVGFGTFIQLSGSATGGQEPLSFHWELVHGPQIVLSDTDVASPTFTTPLIEDFLTSKEQEGTTIVAISPDDREVVLQLTVTDAAGATAVDQVVIEMTETVSSGLNNVGAETEIFLSGREGQAGYDWIISLTPPGSFAAVLERENSRTPTFVPDAPGFYRITEQVSGDSIELNAGLWVGRTFGCRGCHRHGPEKARWEKTGHAGFFARGVNGKVSPSYNEGCIRCHTVGYNKNASNGGFDDVQRELGWEFPGRLGPGNFKDIPQRLRNLANIQCENCHGPLSQHQGEKGTMAVGFGSGVCQQCHAEAPYHNLGIEWENSKHAVLVRSPAGRDPNQPRPGQGPGCIRCHTAQGFVQQTRKQALSLPENPQPQTCVTCHDPHSNERKDQLRLVGKVDLPNGEKMKAGVAAACVTCHNSRRNTSDPATLSGRFAPHFGPQGEMLAGTGAFEVGGRYDISFHASDQFVLPGETQNKKCVTCHMAPGPPEGAPGHHRVGGHSFNMHTPEPGDTHNEEEEEEVDDPHPGEIQNVAICQKCHRGLTSFDRLAGADYDGNGLSEGIQTEVDHLLDILAEAINDSLEGGFGDGLHGSFAENRGQFVFKNAAGQGVTPADAQVIAAYNHHFVENDGSLGIHNTAYTLQLLQRSYRNLAGHDITGAFLR